MMKQSHRDEMQSMRMAIGAPTPVIARFLAIFALLAVMPVSAEAAPWTAQPSWSPPAQLPSTRLANAAVGDLNGDGLPDLLFGEYDNSGPIGFLVAYENSGTVSAPAWTAAPSSWTTLNGTACKRQFNGQLHSDDGMYKPALADMDGDGKLDLMIGSRNFVCIYQNTGTTASPIWTRNASWETVLEDLNANRAYNPSMADLDGDGYPDLRLMGGGSTFYKNTGSGSPFVPSWTEEPTWGPVGKRGRGAGGHR